MILFLLSKFAFDVGPLSLALGIGLADDLLVGAIGFDDYTGTLAALFQSLMVSVGIVACICRHRVPPQANSNVSRAMFEHDLADWQIVAELQGTPTGCCTTKG